MFSRELPTGFTMLAFAAATPIFAAELQGDKPTGEFVDEGIVVLDSGISEEDVEKKPYADYVTECVDLLMEFGTDRYGEHHKPVLVTILDVRSRLCPESPPENTSHWRGQWRSCFWKPHGSDLLVDQSTVEVFYLLSELTENRKYATFADMYGRTISLFIHLYALTGEQSYLRDARRTAREAVSRLYYKGLLRGHPAKPFYSSVDGVGYLLYALLQLDRVLENPDAVVGAKAIPLGDNRGTINFDNW